MPQYYSLTEEIFDHIDMMRNPEDKWVKKVEGTDGSITWTIGRREFEPKFHKHFEDFIARGWLKEYGAGNYSLTEEGEKACKEFAKISI